MHLGPRRARAWLVPVESVMSDIVQKPGGFCHTLRYDGIDYHDYIEQIKVVGVQCASSVSACGTAGPLRSRWLGIHACSTPRPPSGKTGGSRAAATAFTGRMSTRTQARRDSCGARLRRPWFTATRAAEPNIPPDGSHIPAPHGELRGYPESSRPNIDIEARSASKKCA